MMNSRRNFLRSSSLLALTMPLSKLALAGARRPEKIPAFGVQLYMVRDAMEKDPLATLRQLGQMGYTQLESYTGPKGMFWGMNNKEFKTVANGYGLTLISSHFSDDDGIPFERRAAMAAEIGMKYLIVPWKGPQKNIDAFKQIAEEFNQRGEICRKHGLRFGYHPHDYPYKPVDGQLPIDVLLHNTDPKLVYYQMDFYYTVTEGQSPEAYLTKYKNRFTMCHMRDVVKNRTPDMNKDISACDMGKGIINYPHLLKVALNNGVEYFFVEQTSYGNEQPMEAAAINANYMKSLQLA